MEVHSCSRLQEEKDPMNAGGEPLDLREYNGKDRIIVESDPWNEGMTEGR